MTNKLSKERLEKIAFGSVRQSQEEGMLLAREALAYREAESKPVAWTDADEIAFRDFGCGDLWEKPHGFGRDIPLYASPVLGQTPALAAAAPELLEALKEMVRNGEKQGWNDNYELSMGKSRAAIAKATGEAK